MLAENDLGPVENQDQTAQDDYVTPVGLTVETLPVLIEHLKADYSAIRFPRQRGGW